ncbi:MAG: hypothetical protein QOE70_820 [Chthoniobacter sp.]|jgi:hypothetical protein|nr:hypothetical protein [Chthoniobacter sp.]
MLESLLRAMRELSPDEVDDVLARLHRLRAAQRKRTLPEREAALLEAINRTPSATARAADRRLEGKRRAETLTQAKHRELLRLSDELELLNAERARSLVALAALRRTTVPELMAALDLESLAHA